MVTCALAPFFAVALRFRRAVGPSKRHCEVKTRRGSAQRLAEAFLSGSMSDCVKDGFVKNAMHPDAIAALRTAGSSLPVM